MHWLGIRWPRRDSLIRLITGIFRYHYSVADIDLGILLLRTFISFSVEPSASPEEILACLDFIAVVC